ncbi:MAG: alanine racemase, partial [Kiritimatiellia bacterium]
MHSLDMDADYRWLAEAPSPCFAVDETALQSNLEVLQEVQRRGGCRIILALKGFAMFSVFPLLRRGLAGTTASSLHEARLGREEFGGEVHLYAPAYHDEEFDDLLRLADHISFNSLNQWRHFRDRAAAPERPVRCGLRINPEHSEVKTALYDPCAPCSRLGITAEQLRGADLEGISGLHFHTLCELNADSLERTLAVVERNFEEALRQVQWVNFGGGHHITRPDYDLDLLCRLVKEFRERHEVEVILEPGEAVALNTGVLTATVLDIV